MKLRTALYDGHTELVTQDELEAASTFVGATIAGSAGDLIVSDGAGNAVAFTAGAGEIVFVDGSGHAATDARFTYDSATDTLTVTDGNFVLGSVAWSQDDGLLSIAGSLGLTLTQGGLFVGLAEGIVDGISLASDFNIAWDDGTGMQSANVGITSSSFVPQAVLLSGLAGNVTNGADLGAPFAEVRSVFAGTLVSAPKFVAAGVGDGLTTTITSASLVGKTITVTGGIITGFA